MKWPLVLRARFETVRSAALKNLGILERTQRHNTDLQKANDKLRYRTAAAQKKADKYVSLANRAIERLEDMIRADDGQAAKEAEKFIAQFRKEVNGDESSGK